MIISRKRFEAEVNKRVEEAIFKCNENFYRENRERDQHLQMRELEKRLIELEKKNGIDHPSHHRGDNVVCAGW